MTRKTIRRRLAKVKHDIPQPPAERGWPYNASRAELENKAASILQERAVIRGHESAAHAAAQIESEAGGASAGNDS
jgi:hypothetical protein